MASVRSSEFGEPRVACWRDAVTVTLARSWRPRWRRRMHARSQDSADETGASWEGAGTKRHLGSSWDVWGVWERKA
eukprot:5052463-Prymnesium_polylepis.1